jgi:hypothetical protein
MACRDDGLALQPIVPEQDRRCFRVVPGGGHRQVGRPARGWERWSRPDPTNAAAHRGLGECDRRRVPPTLNVIASQRIARTRAAVAAKHNPGQQRKNWIASSQELLAMTGKGRRAKPRLGESVTRIEVGAKNFLGLPVPAGVDHAQAWEFEPDRKGLESIQCVCMGTGPLADLAQELFVLLEMHGVMRAQEAAACIGLRPAQGIEFVIAHDGKGGALSASFARLGSAHAHGDIENIALLRAAVDEVADKDGAAVGMTEHAVVFAVVHFVQQAPEGVGVAVDVADDVEIDFGHG